MREINNIAERRYIKDKKAAKATLKYVLHRNDAGQRMTREMYQKRVAPRGLGTDYQEMLDALEKDSSPYVFMWMYVISPDPLVQQLLPPGQEKAALVEMADIYMEGLYAGLGYETPLYTTIIHDSIASNNLHRYHAHIIAPGMTPDLESGMMRNVYIEKRKGHFEVSDQVREAALDQVMTHYAGPDWLQRIPALPGSLEEWETKLDDFDFELPEPKTRRPAPELPDVVSPPPVRRDVDYDFGF
jgi:hypothetical protein